MPTRFIDHFGSGVAASRPAASAVPQGYHYFATDTLLISRSDGTSTWTTVFNAGAALPPTAPADATQVLLGTGAYGILAVLAVDTQTGTTYTLVLGDGGKLVTLSNASAITMTVPPNSSVAFAVGTQIAVAQLGAGQVTVAPGSGVTISSRGAALKIAGQYGMATLVKTATDTWLLSGDVTT
jgi:hypothetical protein